MKVSVIIPAYNEEKFIGQVIEQVLALNTSEIGYTSEIVVVDDGSHDQTRQVVQSFPVTYIFQENKGKGAAVQNGIRHASGACVIIQDADLEYDIQDIMKMLKALKSSPRPHTTAVYGSRVMRERPGRKKPKTFALRPLPGQKIGPWLANILLSTFAFLFYGKWISDTLTGYKLYPKDFFSATTIESKGFEADHEITAKLIRNGYTIIEVPASYTPRSKEEGKKISSKDGFIALLTFAKYRFSKKNP